MPKISLERAREDLLCRAIDIVFDAVKLKTPRLRVIDGKARPRIIIARLPNRANRDDIFDAILEGEILSWQLLDAMLIEREDFAEMRMSNQRERVQLVADWEAIGRLLGREDIIELFDTARGAMGESEIDVVEIAAIREAL